VSLACGLSVCLVSIQAAALWTNIYRGTPGFQSGILYKGARLSLGDVVLSGLVTLGKV
jgi:hypothetical protein